MKSKIKTYVLHKLKKKKMKTLKARASNYIKASRKMGVSPYELRTYGYIQK